MHVKSYTKYHSYFTLAHVQCHSYLSYKRLWETFQNHYSILHVPRHALFWKELLLAESIYSYTFMSPLMNFQASCPFEHISTNAANKWHLKKTRAILMSMTYSLLRQWSIFQFFNKRYIRGLSAFVILVSLRTFAS